MKLLLLLLVASAVLVARAQDDTIPADELDVAEAQCVCFTVDEPSYAPYAFAVTEGTTVGEESPMNKYSMRTLSGVMYNVATNDVHGVIYGFRKLSQRAWEITVDFSASGVDLMASDANFTFVSSVSMTFQYNAHANTFSKALVIEHESSNIAVFEHVRIEHKPYCQLCGSSHAAVLLVLPVAAVHGPAGASGFDAERVNYQQALSAPGAYGWDARALAGSTYLADASTLGQHRALSRLSLFAGSTPELQSSWTMVSAWAREALMGGDPAKLQAFWDAQTPRLELHNQDSLANPASGYGTFSGASVSTKRDVFSARGRDRAGQHFQEAWAVFGARASFAEPGQNARYWLLVSDDGAAGAADRKPDVPSRAMPPSGNGAYYDAAVNAPSVQWLVPVDMTSGAWQAADTQRLRWAAAVADAAIAASDDVNVLTVAWNAQSSTLYGIAAVDVAGGSSTTSTLLVLTTIDTTTGDVTYVAPVSEFTTPRAVGDSTNVESFNEQETATVMGVGVAPSLAFSVDGTRMFVLTAGSYQLDLPAAMAAQRGVRVYTAVVADFMTDAAANNVRSASPAWTGTPNALAWQLYDLLHDLPVAENAFDDAACNWRRESAESLNYFQVSMTAHPLTGSLLFLVRASDEATAAASEQGEARAPRNPMVAMWVDYDDDVGTLALASRHCLAGPLIGPNWGRPMLHLTDYTSEQLPAHLGARPSSRNAGAQGACTAEPMELGGQTVAVEADQYFPIVDRATGHCLTLSTASAGSAPQFSMCVFADVGDGVSRLSDTQLWRWGPQSDQSASWGFFERGVESLDYSLRTEAEPNTKHFDGHIGYAGELEARASDSTTGDALCLAIDAGDASLAVTVRSCTDATTRLSYRYGWLKAADGRLVSVPDRARSETNYPVSAMFTADDLGVSDASVEGPTSCAQVSPSPSSPQLTVSTTCVSITSTLSGGAVDTASTSRFEFGVGPMTRSALLSDPANAVSVNLFDEWQPLPDSAPVASGCPVDLERCFAETSPSCTTSASQWRTIEREQYGVQLSIQTASRAWDSIVFCAAPDFYETHIGEGTYDGEASGAANSLLARSIASQTPWFPLVERADDDALPRARRNGAGNLLRFAYCDADTGNCADNDALGGCFVHSNTLFGESKTADYNNLTRCDWRGGQANGVEVMFVVAPKWGASVPHCGALLVDTSSSSDCSANRHRVVGGERANVFVADELVRGLRADHWRLHSLTTCYDSSVQSTVGGAITVESKSIETVGGAQATDEAITQLAIELDISGGRSPLVVAWSGPVAVSSSSSPSATIDPTQFTADGANEFTLHVRDADGRTASGVLTVNVVTDADAAQGVGSGDALTTANRTVYTCAESDYECRGDIAPGVETVCPHTAPFAITTVKFDTVAHPGWYSVSKTCGADAECQLAASNSAECATLVTGDGADPMTLATNPALGAHTCKFCCSEQHCNARWNSDANVAV